MLRLAKLTCSSAVSAFSSRIPSTLAHELGHAYHAWVTRDMALPNTSYGMNLAETASMYVDVWPSYMSPRTQRLPPRNSNTVRVLTDAFVLPFCLAWSAQLFRNLRGGCFA
jgi:Peptidase family M3